MKFMDLWIYDTRWNDTQCYDTQYKYIYDSNVQHKGSQLKKENAKLSITSVDDGCNCAEFSLFWVSLCWVSLC